MLVIFVCFGKAVPDVNESHYLPKAKNAWDKSYAPLDLFVNSNDSHLAATTLAGSLTRIASLPTVAWIGRLLSWSLFAWAWIGISQALRISAALSPLALASWYFAIKYGHWAGEWAIGGFEAKAIAYPFVLKGLADCIEGRWKSVWLWMGMAVAWHPVVGGWALLAVGSIWITTLASNLVEAKSQIRSQLPWIICGGLIGLVGVLPALSGLGGSGRLGKVVASQVQVFYRLAHHMCPRTFAVERHVAAAASLLALCVAAGTWIAISRRSRRAPCSTSDSQHDSSERLGRLMQFAAVSVGFSLCGLIIDLFLSPYQPNLASKLLRFYWFRLSDVAVPLAWTLTFWHYVSNNVFRSAEQRVKFSFTDVFGRLALGLGAITVGCCMVWTFEANWRNQLPPADELVVHSTGPRRVETDDRYRDWLAVCAWIRENTPPDSLWLTPKYQQTFKWHAQRSEVVCWKDVPQDNASILEWYDRIQTCEPPRTPEGKLAEWSTADLKRLHRIYGFGWILVDRTIQGSPPNLEIMYPVNIDNRSFAVFRIDSR